MTKVKEASVRERSPDYPAVSLPVAIELVRKIYDRDRRSWTTSATAAAHLGYSSLNGKSRTVLSALKKYGLIEYRGGDLRVTDAAMEILVPKSDDEKAVAISRAMALPKAYQWIIEEYPGWELPSDDTLRARLIRDRGFQPGAVSGFVSDLREGLTYAKSFDTATFSEESAGEQAPGEAAIRDEEDARPAATSMARGEPGHRLSVPGSAWYVWMPDDLSPSDAARMQSWVNFVLVPQLKFIAGDVDTGGGDGV